MNAIKLLALDLDGTLLNSFKKISPRNQQALRLAREKGVKVVFNTGRPLVSIQEYLDLLGLRGSEEYTITYNGGLVSTTAGQVLCELTLDYEQVQEVLQVAQANDLPADVMAGGTAYTIEWERLSRVHYINNTITFVPATAQTLSADLTYNKIILSADEATLDAALASFGESLSSQFAVVKTRDILLEVMPLGVSKATGLAFLAERLDIKPEEVLAMGDEDNDASMLAWAGLGVAPANSKNTAREAANVLSPLTNDEDAVADAIERYIL